MTFHLQKTLLRKRKVAAWLKIFANHKSYKGLTSRIYKEFSQLNNRKTTQHKKGKMFEQTTQQRRYMDVKLAHETMFNIISH